MVKDYTFKEIVEKYLNKTAGKTDLVYWILVNREKLSPRERKLADEADNIIIEIGEGLANEEHLFYFLKVVAKLLP